MKVQVKLYLSEQTAEALRIAAAKRGGQGAMSAVAEEILRKGLDMPAMFSAAYYGVTEAGIELARKLCEEAGLDTMTEETFAGPDNQLWQDNANQVWTGDKDLNDALNAAAKGDAGALAALRRAFGLPVLS